uniref:Putative secreted protein n=1 Tax=Anopheles marajoara TaxID=58244 RepID=A0A2M4C8X1_9DIPT
MLLLLLCVNLARLHQRVAGHKRAHALRMFVDIEANRSKLARCLLETHRSAIVDVVRLSLLLLLLLRAEKFIPRQTAGRPQIRVGIRCATVRNVAECDG